MKAPLTVVTASCVKLASSSQVAAGHDPPRVLACVV